MKNPLRLRHWICFRSHLDSQRLTVLNVEQDHVDMGQARLGGFSSCRPSTRISRPVNVSLGRYIFGTMLQHAEGSDMPWAKSSCLKTSISRKPVKTPARSRRRSVTATELLPPSPCPDAIWASSTLIAWSKLFQIKVHK